MAGTRHHRCGSSGQTPALRRRLRCTRCRTALPRYPSLHFIGGDFKSAGTIAVRGLAHIRADGSVDPALTVRFNDRVYALGLEGNALYVGGHFTSAGGVARNHLAAIDLTTNQVASWDPQLADPVPPIGVAPIPPAVRSIGIADGVVYAAGCFGAEQENLVALNDTTAATIWSGPSASGVHFATAVSGPTLFVGGEGGVRAFNRTTGAPLASSPSVHGEVHALAVSGDTLYAGGNLDAAGGATRGGAAAFDLTTFAVTPFDPKVEQSAPSVVLVSTFVESISVQGDMVYLGGSFERVEGLVRRHLAAVDATTGQYRTWHVAAPARTKCQTRHTEYTTDELLCNNAVFAVQARAACQLLSGGRCDGRRFSPLRPRPSSGPKRVRS